MIQLNKIDFMELGLIKNIDSEILMYANDSYNRISL